MDTFELPDQISTSDVVQVKVKLSRYRDLSVRGGSDLTGLGYFLTLEKDGANIGRFPVQFFLVRLPFILSSFLVVPSPFLPSVTCHTSSFVVVSVSCRFTSLQRRSLCTSNPLYNFDFIVWNMKFVGYLEDEVDLGKSARRLVKRLRLMREVFQGHRTY